MKGKKIPEMKHGKIAKVQNAKSKKENNQFYKL